MWREQDGQGNGRTGVVLLEGRGESSESGIDRLEEKREANGLMEQRLRIREMEDSIFEESAQIFSILNDSCETRVDGLAYQQIYSSPELTLALDQIRENSPFYQHLSKRKKSFLFSRLSMSYLEKLQGRGSSAQQKWAEWQRDLSQNEVERNTNHDSQRFQSISTYKRKLISKERGKFADQPKKRISFSRHSTCKYFSSHLPARTVRGKVTYSFTTA